MKTKFLVLTAAFFFALAPSFAGNGVPATSTEIKETTQGFCGVSAQQIRDYMKGNGINIVTMCPITGSCNVLATSDVGKNYIIYIDNGTIVGYDDWTG